MMTLSNGEYMGFKNHISAGIQFQTDERLLFDFAKKNNLELVKSKRDSDEFC